MIHVELDCFVAACEVVVVTGVNRGGHNRSGLDSGSSTMWRMPNIASAHTPHSLFPLSQLHVASASSSGFRQFSSAFEENKCTLISLHIPTQLIDILLLLLSFVWRAFIVLFLLNNSYRLTKNATFIFGV